MTKTHSRTNTPPRIARRFAATASLLLALTAAASHAATLRVTPAGAQPGDILTVSVYPASGEKIVGLSMNAYDTPEVKFYLRNDGIARGFLAFPFDRHGGPQTLRANVTVDKGGRQQTQTLTTTFQARERYYPTQRIRMNSSGAATMNRTDALRAEKRYVQSKMKNSYAAPLWQGSWVTPTPGTSSSAYGRRRYVNGKWWGQHNGADVKAPSGAKILAANSGRVVLSEYLPTLRGNCVVIDHGCNVYSLYLHMSKRLVNVGQTVGRGQLIGRVGATGFVTGPHLHWEVRIGWEPVDPNRVLARGISF